MESKRDFKSQIFTGLLPVFFALLISTGALLQFRAPSDESLNLSLLFMATLTFFLGMTLLPLCLAMHSTKSPNPTFTRLTAHLATVTLIASFSTLLLALPDQTSPAFTNSTIFSHWSVAWASQCGLILFAVTMLYNLIIEIPTSWFQQCTKVVVFTLCVSLASLYAEPVTFPYNWAIYRTNRIYHFALVPFTFALGVILLILGVAVPNNSTCSCISASFKEVFATLTLSVACITLLIGAFLKVGVM